MWPLKSKFNKWCFLIKSKDVFKSLKLHLKRMRKTLPVHMRSILTRFTSIFYITSLSQMLPFILVRKKTETKKFSRLDWQKKNNHEYQTKCVSSINIFSEKLTQPLPYIIFVHVLVITKVSEVSRTRGEKRKVYRVLNCYYRVTTVFII